jgi:hypothetical protein
MTFREASTRALVIAAIPLMAGGAAAAADHRIALQVQSKSWIPSSAFDVEQFDSQCSAVGIELVAPASPLPVAATAVVTYVEPGEPDSAVSGSVRRWATGRTFATGLRCLIARP